MDLTSLLVSGIVGAVCGGAAVIALDRRRHRQ